jgi:hypothetical protein
MTCPRPRLIAMALWALCGLFACDDGVSPDDACRNVCDCQEPLPAANRQCVAACVSELEAQPVADACLECLGALSCAQVGAGTPCFACETPDGPFVPSGRTALSP